MSIAGALSAHLKADVDVSLKVGSQTYRGTASQTKDVPYLVIQRIGGRRARHMTAVSGLAGSLLQIKCVANDPVEADELDDAVREALDHFQGTMGTPPNTAEVQAVFLELPIDLFEPPRDASDEGTHVVLVTAQIWHTETVPVFPLT